MSKEKKENAIYIGKKGTMNYCLVVVTIFNKGEKECVIRARGRSISKAVDVAEISTRKFLPEIIDIADVKIGSEELEGEHGLKTVSTIDIVLKRKATKK
ncbi:MAG: DNA-binding protein Alba [Candidatus Heimdallarchaeota archaeon]|nr:DNA-binding protein Alba [Candidatus Heimdallarchaeota archaeon]MCK4955116.1 DNA-binding protein Alba [Candidatus Heimdallarchaeota archaeon]